jgi:ribosome biogenesis GTPase
VTGLDRYGWNEHLQKAFDALGDESLEPARVAAEHRNRYVLYAADAVLTGHLPGRLRREGERPVVGDWVAVKRADDETATIQAILPRKSAFSRKVAGRTLAQQVMAANIDTLFIATSLAGDINPRRLERYLVMAWESGARPVVLLTKADLAPDPAAALAQVETVAVNVPVHVVSSLTGAGLDQIEPYLRPGSTVAVVGSSGVGKSTLINALIGEERVRTGDVREDGRGRHTTTARELIVLPSGALIIDTPGLRELQVWEGETGFQDAFADIEELAQHCRFRDCAHEAEPGCAVRDAVERGELPADRLESYHALRREMRAIEERMDVRARSESKREARSANRALRKRLRDKDA